MKNMYIYIIYKSVNEPLFFKIYILYNERLYSRSIGKSNFKGYLGRLLTTSNEYNKLNELNNSVQQVTPNNYL
jgi:hypothetical protein